MSFSKTSVDEDIRKNKKASYNINHTCDNFHLKSGEIYTYHQIDTWIQGERSLFRPELPPVVPLVVCSSSPVPLDAFSSSASSFAPASFLTSQSVSRLNPFSSLPLRSFHQRQEYNSYLNPFDCTMNQCTNKVPCTSAEASPVERASSNLSTIVTTMASTIIIMVTTTVAKSSPRVTVFPWFHGRTNDESLMCEEDGNEKKDDDHEYQDENEKREDEEQDREKELLQLHQDTSLRKESTNEPSNWSDGEIVNKIASPKGRSKCNLLLVFTLLMTAISSFSLGKDVFSFIHLTLNFRNPCNELFGVTEVLLKNGKEKN